MALLGEKFDNICRTPLRFDNPDVAAIEFAKKMFEWA